MSQTIGVIRIVWRGVEYDMEKGSKIKIGGWTQKGMAVQGKHHWSREYEVSEIDGTTVLKRGQDPLVLFAGGEGELQCLCDTGQSFTFGDAVMNPRPEITGGDGGKVACKWTVSEPETLLNG